MPCQILNRIPYFLIQGAIGFHVVGYGRFVSAFVIVQLYRLSVWLHCRQILIVVNTFDYAVYVLTGELLLWSKVKTNVTESESNKPFQIIN